MTLCLAANPGYTCAAVVTLALGIGANTAIYSVIDGVLLHPIPFSEPDGLVSLHQKRPSGETSNVSYPDLLDWQRQSQTFEAIAGWLPDSVTLTVHVDGPMLLLNPPMEVATMANQLQRDSALPLLIAADFERGLASRVSRYCF